MDINSKYIKDLTVLKETIKEHRGHVRLLKEPGQSTWGKGPGLLGPCHAPPLAPPPPRPVISCPGRCSTRVLCPFSLMGWTLPPLPWLQALYLLLYVNFGFMAFSLPGFYSVPLICWSLLCQCHVLVTLDLRWMFVPARIIPFILHSNFEKDWNQLIKFYQKLH